MTRPQFLWGDARGVSVVVNYVLALALVTILLSGLLVAANGFVEDRREQAARNELEAVGNQIATDVSKIDRLTAQGTNVSIQTARPELSAAGTYRVALTTDCGPTNPNACVRLHSVETGATVRVPLNNRTDLSLSATGGGYQISANGSIASPTRRLGGVAPNIGVGRGVSSRPSNQDVVDPANRDPIPGFAYQPDTPFPNETVLFVNDTTDLDGNIASFTWDFGDGSPKRSGGVTTHAYEEPGRYDVTMTVTDTEGATANLTRQLIVTGLIYNEDARAYDVDGDLHQGAVQFSVHNRYDDPVYVTDILVDPEDNTSVVSGLSDRDGTELDYYDSDADDKARGTVEVYVTGTDEGWVDYGQYGGTDTTEGLELSEGGEFVRLNGGMTDTDYSRGHNDNPSENDGDSAVAEIAPGTNSTIELTEFRENVSMGGRNITIGVRYTVNGSVLASRFVVEPISGPEAVIALSPDDPEADEPVDFDGTPSFDPQGTIQTYEWDFGDGTNATGISPIHTYDSAGLYVVKLTVTDDDGYSDTSTAVVTVANGDVVLAENLGGGDYTSQAGIEYESTYDGSYYNWGYSYYIDNTQDDYIYQSGYYDSDEITIERYVGNGDYVVTLLFNDPTGYWDVDTDVYLEGSQEADELDVSSEAGGDHAAYELTRSVTVSDGWLTVDLRSGDGEEAAISGIVVYEDGGGSTDIEPPPDAFADRATPVGGGDLR